MRRIQPLSSSVGVKLIVALSGVALFAYLVLHLMGNLLFFAGPGVFNGYAHFLTNNPGLPVFEYGLLAVFLLHIYQTTKMTLANWAARPVKYHMKRNAGFPSRKSAASSTMIWTGWFIIFFVIWHLIDLRFGPHYEVAGSHGVRDLYLLQQQVFSHPFKVAFYVLAMIVLGFHLWHAFWSATQSLGVSNPKRSWQLWRAGKIIAVLMAGAFLVIPPLVYFFHNVSVVTPVVKP